MDIADWLKGLGLAQYAAAFRENDITEALLPKLTGEDLKDLGVATVGHRRMLLDAIAASTADGKAPDAATARTPGPEPQAERRQLTVMFCDLVGSTALSARLDPEDLRAVIGAYHRCVAKVMGRGGGFVAKYMGDGVLAYFGYPRADEHDAERAVRAALKLVESVAGLDTVAAVRLQVRVGIATGLVVVGDLIGEGASQEQAVVGETPNLAARLQALAEPGTVVIAPSTRRLTGGLFEYADLGAVELKGLGAPVMAARVLRGSAAESRFEALRGHDPTPLVGRDEELALLTRRWQQAKAGEGRVVVLIGEPGIGKSRLAQAMLEEVTGEPHTRLRYFCSPHHQASALHPFITQLEHAAGFSREDMAEARLAKLEALLARSNAGAEETGFIAALLSLPTGDKYPLPDLTPQRRKEKTFEALLAQLARLAARTPVLMLFEDAHWIDPTSLELLTLTVARASTLPLLLLVTARPEFTPPWPADAHVTTLPLARLGRREGMTLVERSAGGKALPAEILEQILARTDGVPLFLEELTKTIIESGLLREEDGHYALDGALPPLAIPTTLHDSLMARLDRLAPVREVAQIGAAIGREFSYPLLSAVAQQPDDRLTGGSGPAGPRRAGVRPRRTPGRRLHLQARAGAGGGLCQPIARAPAAAPRPDRPGARRRVPGSGRDPAGTGRTPLRRRRARRSRHRLLSPRRGAGDGGLGQRRGDRPFDQGPRADRLAPGIGRADLAGDRLPPRARHPPYCHTRVGICRGAGRLHPSQGVVCGRRRDPRALSQPCGVVGLSCASTRSGDRVGAFPAAFQPRSKARERRVPFARRIRRLHHLLLASGRYTSVLSHAAQVRVLYDPERHRGPKIFMVDPAMAALTFESLALWSLGYPERASERGLAALAMAPDGGSSVQPVLGFVVRGFAQDPAEGTRADGRADQSVSGGRKGAGVCV